MLAHRTFKKARVCDQTRAFRTCGRQALRVNARFGGGRGNVLDRPDVDVSKRLGGFDLSDFNLGGGTPSTESGRNGSGVDKDKQSPPGGGNYRVILVDSPQHSEKVVVRAICTVVPSADEAHARNCFHTSKQLGMALITTALKEHAEFYRQQLYVYGCRTAIEPDSTVA
ncbi:ATP-dependent Clp protease adapter protein clps2, chloroplastic [Pleodorina starrii]|uniref:ATP-dependent Clp protease adapter protein clps2, chloroplastic n=1 Tax=Pleodorina starrii TaxID=330485 RepID=A0A9W6F5S8_9CHLO|nr:ATP-dependent Clp protease adapter protein clps2 [Pleodorina starrii]GLC57537.1 ATP-dependent Clp protease adapter protein clps2, chloroplastic [Pleodorina starrii]GLC63209.1 ATP-dependent Clp protease adapter protein clps2 [Pleodorina starrii]